MNIETIYQEIDKIILKNIMLNDDSMKICQSLGLNGFKRLHRCNIKSFLNHHIELENGMFDKYRKVLDSDPSFAKYKVNSIKEHLYQWKTSLESDINEISKLNKEHFLLTGSENSVSKCIYSMLLHDYEKTCRWYCRFEDTQWNMHDIHSLDDLLHKKYKEIEEN